MMSFISPSMQVPRGIQTLVRLRKVFDMWTNCIEIERSRDLREAKQKSRSSAGTIRHLYAKLLALIMK